MCVAIQGKNKKKKMIQFLLSANNRLNHATTTSQTLERLESEWFVSEVTAPKKNACQCQNEEKKQATIIEMDE